MFSFAEVVHLGSFEQYGTLLWRCRTLVGLADNDAVAFELHILLLDDYFELVDLLFELLYAPIQAGYLFGLNGDDLVGVFELCAISLGILLAPFLLEEYERSCQAAGKYEIENNADRFHSVSFEGYTCKLLFL